MWRVYTEFGTLLIRIEDSHLLKLQAAYKRPDKLSPESALVFANKWNIDQRFTKLAIHSTHDFDMVLEYDADLHHVRPGAVDGIVEMFHASMMSLQLQLYNELTD